MYDQPEARQASAPGIVISPMGVGKVLDTGFNLARRNFRSLVTLGLWGLAPASLFYGIGTAVFNSGQRSASFIFLGVVAFAAYFVGQYLAYSVMALACGRLIVPTGGRDARDAGDLYWVAMTRIPAMIGFGLVVGLASIPLIIVFPLGIYVWNRWWLAWYAILIEGVGPIEALGRSWTLTRNAWWHTFFAVFATSIVSYVLAFILAIIVGAVGGIVTFVVQATVIHVVISALTQLTTIVVYPFAEAMPVVLYYELRARNEGFDLQQRAAQATVTG
ncbi:MAG: hypothetical protein QOF51_3501 [Chloroflexota bacterium]|jgi:hypothetical protein|nr:hypothetical protein [Chloroflexota bacterium]